jgi:hypothetical protein
MHAQNFRLMYNIETSFSMVRERLQTIQLWKRRITERLKAIDKTEVALEKLAKGADGVS